MFCEGDANEVVNRKRLLVCFEVVPGLTINFHKSVVCEVSLEEEQVKVLADLVNCKVACMPLYYVGLPLGANPRLRTTWKPILDKLKGSLPHGKRDTSCWVVG